MYTTTFPVQCEDGSKYNLNMMPLLMRRKKDDSLDKFQSTASEEHNVHLLVGHYITPSTEEVDAQYKGLDGVYSHAAMADVVLCHTYGPRATVAKEARHSKVTEAVQRISKSLYGHVMVKQNRGPSKAAFAMDQMKAQFKAEVLSGIDLEKLADMVADRLTAPSKT